MAGLTSGEAGPKVCGHWHTRLSEGKMEEFATAHKGWRMRSQFDVRKPRPITARSQVARPALGIYQSIDEVPRQSSERLSRFVRHLPPVRRDSPETAAEALAGGVS